MSQLSFLSLGDSAHGYGHIDPQVPVVSKQLGDAGVEHEAVRVEDGRGHTLVYWPRCGLPGQPPSVTVQL